MSLEKDAAEIKMLVEAKPLFKPASKDQLVNRAAEQRREILEKTICPHCKSDLKDVDIYSTATRMDTTRFDYSFDTSAGEWEQTDATNETDLYDQQDPNEVFFCGECSKELKDGTDIHVYEAGEKVFKPASKEQIANRPDPIRQEREQEEANWEAQRRLPAWYSIRVVHASDGDEGGAEEQVLDERFDEEHPLCDRIIQAKHCKIFDPRFGETFTEARQVFKPATPGQIAARPKASITADDIEMWAGGGARAYPFLIGAIVDIANGDYTVEELHRDIESTMG